MTDEVPMYLTGYAREDYKDDIFISYAPVFPDESPTICVQIGIGRSAQGPMLSPTKILEFQPHKINYEVIDGELKMAGMEQEPPGWFARRCAEANCSWFVPMVERMAQGEEVLLEEIQATYREHNDGKEMLESKWGSPFPV